MAKHFDFPYYDVDEVKKTVYRRDPNFHKNIAEGVPFADELRLEVFRRVFSDLETLIVEHPHIVVDEALHKREIRHLLYDEALRIAGDFIVVWVQAKEDVIVQRLSTKKRIGHILDDPLPLHHTLRKVFDEYNRCVINCPNNGTADSAVADLVRLIDSIGSLAQRRSKER